jgi:hypothetical protein
VTRQRPVALGYVAARDAADMADQRALVTTYASTEGLSLADILDDHRDGLTISQIVDIARLHDATAVIVPDQSRLASAYVRLAYELEQHSIRCVLIGADKAVLPGRITTARRPARADTTSL